MTERWRCFVAAPITDPLKSELATVVAEWPQHDELRWTRPEDWHLTLAFLGAVDAAAIEQVRATIADVATRHGPMRLELGGLGTFPGGPGARVVWYGIKDSEARLAAVARDLGSALGLDTRSPFRAHVTLARVRRGSADLRAWLSAAGQLAPDSMVKVRHLALMRSRLGTDTPRYETLATLKLGGGRDG